MNNQVSDTGSGDILVYRSCLVKMAVDEVLMEQELLAIT
jgi:hypothetical protein